MRYTLVTETFPPEINGVAMTLERLALAMQRRQHRVTIVRPRQATDPQPAPTLETHLTPGLPLPGYPGLRFGLPVFRRLRTLWAAQRPDLIHVATEGPLGYAAIRTARALGIPIVSSFHTNFHAYGDTYGYGMFKRTALAYLRHVHNQTQITFPPSQDLMESLRAEGFRNLQILGRGVDTQLFSPARRSQEIRASWGVPNPDTPVALYVGRLAGEKNLPLVIESWKVLRQQHPDTRLVLVGDGPERERLRRTFPEIHFAGMKLGEDLAAHYASADCFLFASTTETFGNVVTEAMASGLLLLTYDYAAGRQCLRDGHNGYLAPYDNPAAFLDKARHLAAHPQTWPRLREAARETAKTYSWDTVFDTYEQTIMALCNRQETAACQRS